MRQVAPDRGAGCHDVEHVQEEWRYALGLCKPVVLALLVDDYELLPRELRPIDARQSGVASRYAEELATLLRQLREDPCAPQIFVTGSLGR